ncbi:uncharacterized protein LOC141673314 [Apium graveolens]|uniref:uncharacterized protein LOC141673314 n=1 Tax=Apium graveolens TaxID=4045 RepID=UPI003D7A3C2A
MQRQRLTEKNDKVALAMIYQGISEDMLLSIAGKKTTKEGWEAIRVMFQGADRVKRAMVQMLKAEFESLCMDDSENLDDFYMKMNGLLSTIRVLGEGIDEMDLEKISVEEAPRSLQAHKERLKGQSNTAGSNLLLIEEEWNKREINEGKLLFIREDWMKTTNKEATDGQSSFRGRECKRPQREMNQRPEANMAQIKNDQPVLLLSELDESKVKMELLNDENIIPKLDTSAKEIKTSQLRYLDNGASNHMTGDKSKFSKLDEDMTGEVKFGDGSTMCIKGNGSISFKYKTGEEKVFNDVFFINPV